MAEIAAAGLAVGRNDERDGRREDAPSAPGMFDRKDGRP
jgi:hypothetical protein